MRRIAEFCIGLAALAACAPAAQNELGPEDLAPEIARELHPIILGRPGSERRARMAGGDRARATAAREPDLGRLVCDRAAARRAEEAAPRRLTYRVGTTTLVMELGACAVPAYRARLPIAPR